MDSSSDIEELLKPTFFLDWDHPFVLKKAQDLVKDISEGNQVKRAVTLFYFVRDEVKYSVSDSHNAIHKETLKSSTTIERGFGFCIPKAILLASIARAIKIPSKLHFFDIINHLSLKNVENKENIPLLFHGFVELYINNRWVEANCAFDKELCLRKNYPVVEFDGINDALFSKTNKIGENFVDYIEDLGTYNDVPHQKIVKAWKERYIRK